MHFPIRNCPGVPINFHPGAFGFQRRVNWHTGVDLYCKDGEPVKAIESGKVVARGIFTGPEVDTPFWETTHYLMIEGPTGVFNYGEIYNPPYNIGDTIKQGQVIANVKRVLFEHKYRPDIPHHSCSMLHLELYTHGSTEPVHWHQFSKPANLLDPTHYIYPLWLRIIANEHTVNPEHFMWDNSSGRTVG